MNINSKKGFTLVELLAVIVILIVVILMAVTIIKNYTLEAKEKTIEANAIVYIKATNSLVFDYKGTDKEISNSLFTVSEINDLGIKINGTKPDSGYVSIKKGGVNYACLNYEDYYIEYDNGKYKQALEGRCKELIREYTFDTPGSFHTLKISIPGSYKIELWGAQGGTYSGIAGKGAYTSGIIELYSGQTLYVYVGGTPTNRSGGYNGGAAGGSANDGTYYGGGGATDVRLVSGNWDDVTSLASRIMVAAGGAGSGYYWVGSMNGGDAGALVGLTGTQNGRGAQHTVATGGTQLSGGLGVNGAATVSGFGFAYQKNTYGTGGGGGYYGGGSGGSTDSEVSAGAGGSSYISGHTGCVAIKAKDNITPKDGCTTGTTDNSCSIHYSGRFFTDTEMIAGNQTMPTHDGTSTMVGNSGNGFVKISFYES